MIGHFLFPLATFTKLKVKSIDQPESKKNLKEVTKRWRQNDVWVRAPHVELREPNFSQRCLSLHPAVYVGTSDIID